MKTSKTVKMRILREFAKRPELLYFVVSCIIAFGLGVGAYFIYNWGKYAVSYCYHNYILDDAHDMYNHSTWIGKDYRFYENGGHSYIREIRTNQKVLKDISWIAGARDYEDSLLCFAKGGFRGFFNKKTGQVDIPADRYRKAWLFSEGLAAMMDGDSTLKFINPAGEVVIDRPFKYADLPDGRGYLFKNGYCVMQGGNQLWGLIDKQGKWVVVPEYDDIEYTDKQCWICYKNGMQGLLNDSLRLVAKPEYLEVLVTDNGIEVLKEDYTRQLLSFNGDILERCMYTDIEHLYYESEVTDPDYEEYDYTLSPYMVYQTTYSSRGPIKVGLMGPDGIPVTPPLYSSIEAVNADCFRCFYDEAGEYSVGEGASVLINKKGQVIE